MNHIDLDLYCCKFYNNDIEIKHKYFLLIPTHKDDTTFRIIFDSNVNPSAETVKHWANQPQYPHCVVEKFHMVQTISKLPENNHNPFERNWTKWLQWQGVTRKKSAKKSKNLSKNSEMNTFILKKQYEDKITKLHIQLLDKEYYINSILEFLKGYYHSPWDKAVYTGFRNMCFEDD